VKIEIHSITIKAVIVHKEEPYASEGFERTFTPEQKGLPGIITDIFSLAKRYIFHNVDELPSTSRVVAQKGLEVPMTNPTPPTGEEPAVVKCLDCGLPYSQHGLDCMLPRAQWFQVGFKNEGGILCATCIAKRASRISGATVIHMVIEIAPLHPIHPFFKGMEGEGSESGR